MKYIIQILILCTFVTVVEPMCAQNIVLRGTVTDAKSHELLVGVRVKVLDTKLGAITDQSGGFEMSLQPGTYSFAISALGYEPYSKGIQLAASNGQDTIFADFELVLAPIEGDEIVVSGTRTQRSIADVPVRVEAVPQEEVEEKILMRPASVSMLLNESPGIRVQNTSATSNTMNIRIQGLDGRYTQLLVDGVPTFSGLGAGFGITQLIPLNLRQVEIVKGANSALYGADAIAGVINFITKEARDEPEFSGILNATTQSGLDASAFFGNRFDALGITLLASYNHQSRFDVNNDNFSDIAGYSRLTLSPKLSYRFSDDLTATLSTDYFRESRLGGVMSASESEVGQPAPYLEQNKSERIGSSFVVDWVLTDGSSIALKTAATLLDRKSYYGATQFNAGQTLLFADASYHLPLAAHDLLFGTTITDEDFRDETPGLSNSRSYRFTDIGVWAQDEFAFAHDWKLLASARVDRHDPFGTFFTPRASLFYKATNELSLRLGVGSGFKAPTIFLEDAELYGFRNVRPLVDVRTEKAQSASFDANYRTIVGDVGIKLNVALYSTWLRDALTIDADSLTNSVIAIRNVDGITWTGGGELTSQLTLGDFKLFVSYVYLNSQQTDRGVTDEIELNPHHWLGVVLMYENAEAQIKAGVENYYTSPQHLYSYPGRTLSPDFSQTGFLIEKGFGNIRLFFNAENIFDTRQSRFGPTFTGDPTKATFSPLHVFAPIEGRVFNGGLRFVIE